MKLRRIKMKKINISHIEKHLFDETKHDRYWDRQKYPYPLIQTKEVKIVKVLNAESHKNLSNIFPIKRHIGS
jgi:hypothetical protein